MERLKTIDQRLDVILKEYPELSKLRHKKRLVWYYWTKWDKLGETMKFNDFSQLTDEESIIRARRRWIELNKSKEVEALQQAYFHRQHALEAKK